MSPQTIVDFWYWWVETHWFWATVLTPWATFLWAAFTGHTSWSIFSFLWILICEKAKAEARNSK